MPRKLFSVFAMLIIFFTVYAQQSVTAVLSDEDVTSFISNYASITSDIDTLRGEYEEFFSVLDATDEEDNPATIITKIRALDPPPEVQAVLKKNGLGDDGFEKYAVILFGTSILFLNQLLSDQMSQADSEEEKNTYAQIQQQLTELKGTIHEDDLVLLSSHQEALLSIMMSDENM